jgi:phospholipid-binding lipoprotein MlaA
MARRLLLTAILTWTACLSFAAPSTSSTPSLMPVLPANVNQKVTPGLVTNPNSPNAENVQPQSGQPLQQANAEASPSPFVSLLPAEPATVEAKDPLEKYNRIVYKINDRLDEYIAKPAAEFYNKIFPRPLNNMVNNFFMNFDTVTTVANDVLQANFYQATSDTWRLFMNTTVGIGGLFDPASSLGLKHNEEDFGLTMAKWGWTDSSYFVIPILGPSTVRDAGGRIVNYELSIFPYIKNVFARNALYIWRLLNQRAQLLRFQGVFDQAAIDPYVFSKNAYLQHRNYLIQRNVELNDPYKAHDMKKYYKPFYLYS